MVCCLLVVRYVNESDLAVSSCHFAHGLIVPVPHPLGDPIPSDGCPSENQDDLLGVREVVHPVLDVRLEQGTSVSTGPVVRSELNDVQIRVTEITGNFFDGGETRLVVDAGTVSAVCPHSTTGCVEQKHITLYGSLFDVSEGPHPVHHVVSAVLVWTASNNLTVGGVVVRVGEIVCDQVDPPVVGVVVQKRRVERQVTTQGVALSDNPELAPERNVDRSHSRTSPERGVEDAVRGIEIHGEVIPDR